MTPSDRASVREAALTTAEFVGCLIPYIGGIVGLNIEASAQRVNELLAAKHPAPDPPSGALTLERGIEKARLLGMEEMHVLMRGETCGPQCTGCRRIAEQRALLAAPRTEGK